MAGFRTRPPARTSAARTTGPRAARAQEHFGDDTTRAAVAGTTRTSTSWPHRRRSCLIAASPAARPRRPTPTTYLDPLQAADLQRRAGSAERRKFDGATLIVDHAFDWGTLTSTTSWRQLRHRSTAPTRTAPTTSLSYVDTANIESNKSLYQEFKCTGNNDRLDWVGGASYYDEDARPDQPRPTPSDGDRHAGATTASRPRPTAACSAFTHHAGA